ncbi:hypothetical protein [Acetivibrio ethanolgignens]|nr:hypothetical protein [Acetivibrio ethanolgignens]
MVEKNEFYRDFSNRVSFNGAAYRADEVLAPVVVDDDYKDYLRTLGLKWDNVETWHFPYSTDGVPVAFIPVKKDEFDGAMKYFNGQVSRYLKRFTKGEWDKLLSIDEMLEAAEDDDKKGYDPTGTTENEDRAFLDMVFNMLIDDLNNQDPKYGKIITLLADGYKKGEVLDLVDLGKGKTQGYSFIEKAQKAARELYLKKYKD